MKEKNSKSVWLAIFFAILIVIYIGFDAGFVQCKLTDCNKLDSAEISQKSISTFKLGEANNVLINKANKLANKINQAEKQNENTVKTREDYDKAATEVLKEQIISNNSNNLNAAKIKNAELNANLKLENVKQTNTNTARTEAQTELNDAYKHLAARHSNRMIWIFLAALFLGLCAASIAYSIFVFKQASSPLWFYWTIVIALGAIVIFGSLVLSSDYMSIVRPMFKESFGDDDLSIDAVSFLNFVGFVAIIFLISASCAILSRVEKLNREIDYEAINEDIAELKSEKELLDGKLSFSVTEEEKTPLRERLIELEEVLKDEMEMMEDYETWNKRLRLILYIGAVMLCVGLLRINITSEWHLLFVNTETAAFLREFFKSSLSAQAGFYTILLTMLYAPVAYFIPDTPKSPGIQKSLKDGILPTIKEFLPRAVALILPLLAKPIIDLVQLIFPKQ